MLDRIACAPCCWGIEEASDAANPSWGKVLMDASESGFRGIELGPDGFFPPDADLLKSAFRVRGLQMCAGKIQQPFCDGAKMPAILEQTENVCQRLAALGVTTLLVMEGIHPERYGYIGQSVTAPRLNVNAKRNFIANLERIIQVAGKYGLRCLLHPGVGGYISYKEEIDFVMSQIPASRLGLCIDIGHAFLDGMDPLALIRQYGARIEHVHVKDVSTEKLRIAIRDKLEWVEAYSNGLITPLGDGDIKLRQVMNALKANDYQGWIVVEHEHSTNDITQVCRDLKRSRNYLAQIVA
ncbi:TIM barrel protein [Vibrio sp. CAU 1672]|uniref:sugar phosphate isomerase/epimerase family protein n=1 Tax=Vibrio sp. CAU 1672 TaxID=3032594 RepID=UPI0023D9A9BA|nr:TIM barrel protein [Vibrio sp. CAU 1672]MDF2153049.1 TIM barrel protein [Vibrio sp. CAU 1672]